jgi:hypothetical protein
MSPLNRIIWMQAFRKKQTEVTIRDGRVFDVDYEKGKGLGFDGHDLALVTPSQTKKQREQQFVPCGWFDMTRCTDDLWVKEDQKEVREGVTPSKAAEIIAEAANVKSE